MCPRGDASSSLTHCIDLAMSTLKATLIYSPSERMWEMGILVNTSSFIEMGLVKLS